MLLSKVSLVVSITTAVVNRLLYMNIHGNNLNSL